eukprot:4847085-Amphidinium_carterae.1
MEVVLFGWCAAQSECIQNAQHNGVRSAESMTDSRDASARSQHKVTRGNCKGIAQYEELFSSSYVTSDVNFYIPNLTLKKKI